MSDLTFVAGRFAYAKVPGSPFWPCVVYTRFDEIPVDFWQGMLKKPLTTKEDEVIVYWVEEWTFSVVKKKSVKGTKEMPVAAVLKEAKSKSVRLKLQAAIDSMLEMEKKGEEDPEVEAAVNRPGQQPLVPSPVMVPQPEAAADGTAADASAAAAAPAGAAKGGSKKGGKTVAAPQPVATTAAAALSGGKAAVFEAPAAASNNKKRKKASDAPAQAPATSAAVEAAAAPAGKQAAKRSKGTGGEKGGAGEAPGDAGAAAGGGAGSAAAPAAAAGGSKGKRKLPATAAAAAQQQQLQQQDPPLDMMAAAPAGAADGGKKKPRKSSTPRAPKQAKQQQGGGAGAGGAAFGHGRRDSETMAAAALVGLSPEPKHQHQQQAHAHAYHQQQHAAAYAAHAAHYQQYYGMYPQHAHAHYHQQQGAYPPQHPHMAAHLQQAPAPGPPYALPAPVPAAPIAPMAAQGSGRKKGEGGRGRKSSSASPAATAAAVTTGGGASGEATAASVGAKGEGEAPAAAATGVAAVVDDDTQENPFLAPWKEIDPDTLARGMRSYALWAPGTFAGFAPDDTRPAPGDEAWANGGEGAAGAAGAAGRPGRKASGRKSMRVSDRLHEIQQGKLPPHTLLICEEYGIKADGGVNVQGGQGLSTHHANAAQPFHVKVHPDVSFICDLHAHLADSEIIGFLAGRFDPSTRTLLVQAPFPCRATARTDDGSTDVEMDPGSEIEVRDVIDRSQMTVVGWYHSHPTFAPEPSLIDIENQHQYQQLMRDEGTGTEPFVGLIVGTYDDSVKQPVSLFRFFHVRRIKMNSSARAGAADSGVNFPMAIEVYVGHNDAAAAAAKPEEEEEEAQAQQPEAAKPEAVEAAAEAEAEAGTVKEEHKGAGMDLLAAVTSNLPSLPTPASSPRGAPATATATEEEKEKPKAEEVAGEAVANGNGAAAAAGAEEAAPVDKPTAATTAAAAAASPVLVADRRTQSIFLAVKENRHRQLPPSKEIWAGIEARFLSVPEGEGGAGDSAHLACLRCTLETVRLLVEYYSRLPTRVDFEEEWRRGTSKGEKFELSLRKRVASLPGLGPDPARRQLFLESLLEFIVAAWVEGTPRRLPQPEDFSGTRRERQKQAAAAREAVLAAEAAAAVKEAEEKGKGKAPVEGETTSAAPPHAPAPMPEAPPATVPAAAGAAAPPKAKVPSIPPPPPEEDEDEEETAPAAAPAAVVAAAPVQSPQQPSPQQVVPPPAAPAPEPPPAPAQPPQTYSV